MSQDSEESVGNAQLAYERIRQAIVEGRLAPGTRLVEQRLATEFGLSRTPVREALRRLEASGLVRTEMNRGAMVRPITREDIEDLYELRAHLEKLAAARAATRATAEERQAIHAAAQRFDESVSAGSAHRIDSMREVSHANQVFHSLIVEASHHTPLAEMLERAVDVPLVFSAFQQFDASELERSGLFHRMIADAIEAGEAERASGLMAEHIFQGRDRLLRGLEPVQDAGPSRRSRDDGPRSPTASPGEGSHSGSEGGLRQAPSTPVPVTS